MFDSPIHHPIVIPMEDPILHTADSPFCRDETCPPCHEDQELVEAPSRQVQDGILTHAEATTIALGKTISRHDGLCHACLLWHILSALPLQHPCANYAMKEHQHP